MTVFEAQHVDLTDWDGSTKTFPRLIKTQLYDNYDAAKDAVNEWSRGLTRGKSNIPNDDDSIQGWWVKQDGRGYGFAIIERKVNCEHDAQKAGRHARPKKESHESVNAEPHSEERGES